MMTKQRVAFVTGAAGGIGWEAAKAFAASGAIVYAADISPGLPEPEESVGFQGRIRTLALDVRDEEAVSDAVDRIIDETGRLDYAFNNAGILLPTLTDEWDVSSFQRCLDINVTGVMRCLKHELRVMTVRGAGAIVNTSSIAGVVGLAGAVAYAASKHAVIGLTKAAALEHAPAGIRINAVCPGPTETPMTAVSRERRGSGKAISGVPMGRSAAASEVAAAAFWLCSDAASYITGHALAVDGGFTAG